MTPASGAANTEIERVFLVDDDDALAALLPTATSAEHVRQGYLAIEQHGAGPVETRVRDREGSWFLTVKGGRGMRRTEVELAIEPERGAALLPLAGDRRIEKVRHTLPLAIGSTTHTAEVDVYGGRFDGLVMVEVEFADDDAAAAFEPPPWFGREVTDDERWGNANLALHGRPDR